MKEWKTLPLRTKFNRYSNSPTNNVSYLNDQRECCNGEQHDYEKKITNSSNWLLYVAFDCHRSESCGASVILHIL